MACEATALSLDDKKFAPCRLNLQAGPVLLPLRPPSQQLVLCAYKLERSMYTYVDYSLGADAWRKGALRARANLKQGHKEGPATHTRRIGQCRHLCRTTLVVYTEMQM